MFKVFLLSLLFGIEFFITIQLGCISFRGCLNFNVRNLDVFYDSFVGIYKSLPYGTKLY